MLLNNQANELRVRASSVGITISDINPNEIAFDEYCCACCAVAGGT